MRINSAVLTTQQQLRSWVGTAPHSSPQSNYVFFFFLVQSILTCGNYKPWSVKRSLFLIGKYWIWPTKNSHLSELAGSVRTRWKKPEVSSSASHWWRGLFSAQDMETATSMKDPLEKEMATHSSILTWEIPWTEKPDRLQSIVLQRVGYDWPTECAYLSNKDKKCAFSCAVFHIYPGWYLWS